MTAIFLDRSYMAAIDSSTEGTAVFSRSTGLPAHMGKATSDLKCKVPDVVKDDWTRLCHGLGMSESELLREVVMVRLYGIQAVRRMNEQRLAMVAGIDHEPSATAP